MTTTKITQERVSIETTIETDVGRFEIVTSVGPSPLWTTRIYYYDCYMGSFSPDSRGYADQTRCADAGSNHADAPDNHKKWVAMTRLLRKTVFETSRILK
jgi:hypothetical protein